VYICIVRRVWAGIIFSLIYAQGSATQPVPYTLADRDRLIKVESDVAALKEQIADLKAQITTTNARIDRLENRIDEIARQDENRFWVLAGLIGTLMALILWDRRQTLRPMERKIAELQSDSEKLHSLIRSLQEYARTHEELRHILQRYGLI